jgi:transcriptional regulator with XRE-family HTH domain
MSPAPRDPDYALGRELRLLRQAAGLTGQELADALGWYQSKVSRIETGYSVPTMTDVAEMLQAIRVCRSRR